MQIADKNGNIVPNASNLVSVEVTGEGTFKAIANGDPTCVESFQKPQMHLFNGALTVIAQSQANKGNVIIKVNAKGVKPATLTIPSL